jgi:hypothetical protein
LTQLAWDEKEDAFDFIGNACRCPGRAFLGGARLRCTLPTPEGIFRIVFKYGLFEQHSNVKEV